MCIYEYIKKPAQLKHFIFRLIMENYVKPENKPEEPVQAIIHSINLDSNVINMNVKIGSKVTNLITFAQNKFEVRRYF